MRAPPLSSSSSSSSDASVNHASPQISKDGNIEGNRSIFSGLAPKIPGLSYLFTEEPTGDITAQSSGNDVNGLTPKARCDPASESQKVDCVEFILSWLSLIPPLPDSMLRQPTHGTRAY